MKARVSCVLTILLSGLIACATHSPPTEGLTAPHATALTSIGMNPYVAACVATEVATAATAEANGWERVRLQSLTRSMRADERIRELAHSSSQANLSVFVGPGASVLNALPRNPTRQAVINDRMFRALAASMDTERSIHSEDRKGILVAASAAVASEYAELARAHEKAFLLALRGKSGRSSSNESSRVAEPARSSPDLEALYAVNFTQGYGNPSHRCRARAAS